MSACKFSRHVHGWFGLLGLWLVALTGCVSQNVNVDKALGSLRAGDDPQAVEWSEKLKQSFYSKDLGYAEAGRVRMLSGDFLGSSTNFAALIDKTIENTENGPVLKMGDVGANVMAGTVTDDRTRSYQLPAYEFISALQYQILNHIFLGAPDAATVEARRAVFAQDQIAEKYSKEVQAAQAKAAEGKNSAAYNKVNTQMKSMEPVLEMTRSSFENGLTWYLCGVTLEQDNDLANANLSYRKAWELMPGNPYIQRDFLRLLRTQDAEAYKSLLAQTGVDQNTLKRDTTEIILIVEEGFVSQRQSMKIPFPVPGVNTVTSVDFPVYRDAPYTPATISIRDGECELGMSALALSMQSLAYRDLNEKIPGIVVRNVTRVATRVAAQVVANQAGDALKYSVMAFNAISAAINKADTRAWYTLPMVSHLYRGGMAPGEHTLELRSNATGFVTRVPVKLTEGETRIVWVADFGGNARVATASLNGKGAPASYHVCGSLLAGYPAAVLPGGPRTLHTALQVEQQATQ
ncbi:MAG: hypothetical protein PHU80_00445 [Kiritimatiellae bacterium]|nr:hypothetical protein [Kiritimatiellia bacterium]